jgi:hypothetical protein
VASLIHGCIQVFFYVCATLVEVVVVVEEEGFVVVEEGF